LDIHVFPPTEANDPQTTDVPPLEILESGTGHGSLTMHLARAIAAANPPPPPRVLSDETQDESTTSPQASSMQDSSITTQPSAPASDTDTPTPQTTYPFTRRAIIHSVELSGKHSRHARKIIRGFRQGLYTPHIDFYTDSVDTWIESQLSSRNGNAATEFLTHAILDMPGVHHRLRTISPALRPDGKLLVFVPSITQIGECLRQVRAHNLPLFLERVVELGEGISNGRVWDVRYVVPRRKERGRVEEKIREEGSTGTSEEGSGTESEDVQNLLVRPEKQGEDEDEPVMVCRPMVGKLTMGGGFVGLWRKKVDDSEPDSSEESTRSPSAESQAGT